MLYIYIYIPIYQWYIALPEMGDFSPQSIPGCRTSCLTFFNHDMRPRTAIVRAAFQAFSGHVWWCWRATSAMFLPKKSTVRLILAESQSTSGRTNVLFSQTVGCMAHGGRISASMMNVAKLYRSEHPDSIVHTSQWYSMQYIMILT